MSLAETSLSLQPAPGAARSVSLAGFVERDDDNCAKLSLLVEGVHCGACVRRIETALAEDPQVENARLNLSTRRLEVVWHGPAKLADKIVKTIDDLGYSAVPYSADTADDRDKARERGLLKALAVAFFATANVMMLSWAVWSGHVGNDMGPATRVFFHWVSALIALPAIAYAGRYFFASAFSALRHGKTNMDVPISLAVILTAVMSLEETIRNGPFVYFDGALALLFVLLIGRYLDHRARGQARSGVQRLAALVSQPVHVLKADGRLEAVPAEGNLRVGR